MTKNFIKELIISLLLCLAIILLLGILLYDYVPMNKTIPNPVSYTTPDTVKQELASSTSVDEEQIIMTYEVDSTDLNNYKTIQNYKPGKANPFSSYETPKNTETNSASGNSSSANSGTSGNNGTNNSGGANDNSSSSATSDNNNNTSGGKFFQDKGTK